MDIKEIFDGISVAGQIEATDIAAISALGFKTILCNRPDHEASGQPEHGAIMAEALKAGLAFEYNPVSGQGISADNVAQMTGTLQSATRPILAYCRSGARSANLFHLAHQK